MKVLPTPQPRVLIADNDLSFARSFQKALAAAGTTAVLASTASEATTFVRHRHDLCMAFVDSQIDTTGGLALMEQLHKVDPGLTVIIMSTNGTVADVVEATKRGAEDYLLKLFDFTAMAEKVGRFRKLFELRPDVGQVKSPINTVPSWDDFVCCSQTMRAVLDEASKVAPKEFSVLLVGESGVGKNMLGRAICAASPWASNYFFQIDCPSFTHDLPAHTRFKPDVPSSSVSQAALQRMFRATAGGTLFLSEVGELPQDIQDKLVEILNGTTKPNPKSVAWERPYPRVLASTSRSLTELRQKYLSKNLYSRVADVVLEIPPLRNRIDDILPLVKYFLARLGHRYKQHFVLSWSGLDLLLRYSFPGNVRELESILERAASHLLRTPRKVSHGDLRPFLDETGIPPKRVSAGEQPMDLRRIEQLAIERALRFAKGNQTRTAALLGINRTTLYLKLRRLKIDPKQVSTSPSSKV